jgi:hypothetical protein
LADGGEAETEAAEPAFDEEEAAGGCEEDAAVSVPIELDEEGADGATAQSEACALPVAEGGGALSPLSGAYLLIVLAEPISEKHKVKMLQKLKQGKESCRKPNLRLLNFIATALALQVCR